VRGWRKTCGIPTGRQKAKIGQQALSPQPPPSALELADMKLTDKQIAAMRDGIEDVTSYLELGGLFNPELMDHNTVRDMLIDFRSLATELLESQAEIDQLKELADKFMWQVRDTCARAEAAEARIAELEEVLDAQRQAASRLRPYIIWQLSDESPGHHPTLPSVFAAFNETFSNPPRSDKPVTNVREELGRIET
jgi:hypothetical protein